MISKSSYQKLKCPIVVITQHTFDLETLTYHIANYLCTLNKKKYGFFYDWACEPVNVSIFVIKGFGCHCSVYYNELFKLFLFCVSQIIDLSTK